MIATRVIVLLIAALLFGAAATRATGRASRLRAVTAGVLLVALTAACSAAPAETTPAPSTPPSAGAPTTPPTPTALTTSPAPPPQSAAPTASAGPSSTPHITPAPTTAPTAWTSPTPVAPAPPTDTPLRPGAGTQWEPIGRLSGEDGELSGLLGTDSGYVAWGGQSDGYVYGLLTAWFSVDGGQWQPTRLAEVVTPCPDSFPQSSAYPFNFYAISDGHRVALVGREFDEATNHCIDDGLGSRGAVWVSDDGKSWSKLDVEWPLGSEWSLVGGWARDGIWQLVGQLNDRIGDELVVIESADLAIWREVSRVATPATNQVQAAYGADGRVALSASADDADVTTTVKESSDGHDWRDVAAPVAGVIGHIVGPRSADQPWLFTVNKEDCFGTKERATVWRTDDFETWQATDFPWVVPRIDYAFRIAAGVLARGGDNCDTTGGEGPPTATGDRVLLSQDGVSWQTVQPQEDLDGYSLLGTDGPAGTLLRTYDGRVWREATDGG